MAKFKFSADTQADCRFYDEKNKWFLPSVKAFFDHRTDEEIKKEIMEGTIIVPILDSESQLQFFIKYAECCWELDFISSIAS